MRTASSKADEALTCLRTALSRQVGAPGVRPHELGVGRCAGQETLPWVWLPEACLQALRRRSSQATHPCVYLLLGERCPGGHLVTQVVQPSVEVDGAGSVLVHNVSACVSSSKGSRGFVVCLASAN